MNANDHISTLATHGGALGVDIGGANLKYATSAGQFFSRSFPMWIDHQSLASVLFDDLKELPALPLLVVTMTGEMADCFASRKEGVEFIVEAVQTAAIQSGVSEVLFYAVDGRFYHSDQAVEMSEKIASANWHALAQYVATEISTDGLLVDIGSTTTDLIPIVSGQVATSAITDFDRLRDGSLVYVGCRRTPVCALVQKLRFRGEMIPVMNEQFATIDDARLLLGHQSEDVGDLVTADGCPRTCEMAKKRLARMIGLDGTALSERESLEIAKQIAFAAKQRIAESISRFPKATTLFLSGHGTDLIDAPPGAKMLSDVLGPNSRDSDAKGLNTNGVGLSRCAPSYAISRLAMMVRRSAHATTE